MESTKLNIIVLGEIGVGKSSIIRRFKSNDFKETTDPTVVADCHNVNIPVNGENFKLILWDTAGQERFRAIIKSYYRKADGVLLVYDVTDYTTFSRLSGWLSDLRKFNEKADVLIVGNKNEDPDKKAVAASVISSFAQQEDLGYLECSAKSGENVNQVFETLVLNIKKMRKIPTSPDINSSIKPEDLTTEQSVNNQDLPSIVPLEDEAFQLHVQPKRQKKWYHRLCPFFS